MIGTRCVAWLASFTCNIWLLSWGADNLLHVVNDSFLQLLYRAVLVEGGRCGRIQRPLNTHHSEPCSCLLAVGRSAAFEDAASKVGMAGACIRCERRI